MNVASKNSKNFIPRKRQGYTTQVPFAEFIWRLRQSLATLCDMKFYAIALIISLAANASLAQEAGEVRVTLDGREHVALLDPTQSDGQAYGSVSLSFRSVDRDDRQLFASLFLGFTYFANREVVDAPDLQILRFPDGKSEYLASQKKEEEGGLVVEILSFSDDCQYLTMSGILHGRMGTTENYGRTIDLSVPLDVKAEFSFVVDYLSF